MRTTAFLLCLALASCGGEESSETPPEITEATDPEASPDTPEVPTAPEEPEDEVVERVSFELPEGRPDRFEQLRTRTVTSRGASSGTGAADVRPDIRQGVVLPQ